MKNIIIGLIGTFVGSFFIIGFASANNPIDAEQCYSCMTQNVVSKCSEQINICEKTEKCSEFGECVSNCLYEGGVQHHSLEWINDCRQNCYNKIKPSQTAFERSKDVLKCIYSIKNNDCKKYCG